jgi:hypothetical protein
MYVSVCLGMNEKSVDCRIDRGRLAGWLAGGWGNNGRCCMLTLIQTAAMAVRSLASVGALLDQITYEIPLKEALQYPKGKEKWTRADLKVRTHTDVFQSRGPCRAACCRFHEPPPNHAHAHAHD